MITNTQALIVARKTNGRCFYCNKPAEEIDHFISKYWWTIWNLSGCSVDNNSVDKTENLVPSCRKCNRQKKNMTPEKFIGNDYTAWDRYERSNQRVGLCVKEYQDSYKKEPFAHYEWLTFIQKHG